MQITDGTKTYTLLDTKTEGGRFFGHPRRKSRIWLPDHQVEALREGKPVCTESRTDRGWVTTNYRPL
jgi:hypothetical protein